MILTYKYRLKGKRAVRQLRRYAYACNQVWNFCVTIQKDVSSSKLVKTRMAKSVLDASWSTFKNFLRYKVSRHGGTFLEVDERFTTQTCSSCGDCASEGRPKGIAGLGIREWACSSCGANHDRDVNAAKNILNLVLSAQRPVEESRSVKRISTL